MAIKVCMAQTAESRYESAFGLLLQREYDSKTPNGNPMNGRWVLRGPTGQLVDFDFSRNDLAERNNIQFHL